ncbi:uncharacterized protein LAJ45_09269 [Morchella importuna]|uniref:uncharacterized protein n=1 Tax=Morchella importuna TaxID=1174673 RepID=UPI001E8D9356|nr:uncharacterized protein LAJ45_09269 [Morchella importuna]KAH8146587.1 hypothetical protein LAJ45_09269 [Morchella importuna]
MTGSSYGGEVLYGCCCGERVRGGGGIDCRIRSHRFLHPSALITLDAYYHRTFLSHERLVDCSGICFGPIFEFLNSPSGHAIRKVFITIQVSCDTYCDWRFKERYRRQTSDIRHR